jgi:hypothetical protein
MVMLPSGFPPTVMLMTYWGRVGVVFILDEEVVVDLDEDDFSFEVFFCANASEAVKLLIMTAASASKGRKFKIRRVFMGFILKNVEQNDVVRLITVRGRVLSPPQRF